MGKVTKKTVRKMNKRIRKEIEAVFESQKPAMDSIFEAIVNSTRQILHDQALAKVELIRATYGVNPSVIIRLDLYTLYTTFTYKAEEVDLVPDHVHVDWDGCDGFEPPINLGKPFMAYHE